MEVSFEDMDPALFPLFGLLREDEPPVSANGFTICWRLNLPYRRESGVIAGWSPCL